MQEDPNNLEYVIHLTCSPDKNAMRKFLDRVLIGEMNPSTYQLFKGIIYFINKSNNTVDNNVDYVIEHFDAICKYFQKNEDRKDYKWKIESIVNTCIDITYTSEQLKKLKDLMDSDSDLKMSTYNFDQEAISLKSNHIQWRLDNSAKINKWFSDLSIHVPATP